MSTTSIRPTCALAFILLLAACEGDDERPISVKELIATSCVDVAEPLDEAEASRLGYDMPGIRAMVERTQTAPLRWDDRSPDTVLTFRVEQARYELVRSEQAERSVELACFDYINVMLSGTLTTADGKLNERFTDAPFKITGTGPNASDAVGRIGYNDLTGSYANPVPAYDCLYSTDIELTLLPSYFRGEVTDQIFRFRCEEYGTTTNYRMYRMPVGSFNSDP